MEIQKHLNKLGHKVKDLVTGREGIITSISFDLYGCVQAVVTTEVTTNTEKPTNEWFDIARLKILSKKPVMKQPNFDFGPVAEGLKGGFVKPIK